MRAKIIFKNENIKKHFFLLMIAPLLIGLMISCMTNFAHAEWNETDPLLKKSPATQGWDQIQTHYSPLSIQKLKKKS